MNPMIRNIALNSMRKEKGGYLVYLRDSSNSSALFKNLKCMHIQENTL